MEGVDSLMCDVEYIEGYSLISTYGALDFLVRFKVNNDSLYLIYKDCTSGLPSVDELEYPEYNELKLSGRVINEYSSIGCKALEVYYLYYYYTSGVILDLLVYNELYGVDLYNEVLRVKDELEIEWRNFLSRGLDPDTCRNIELSLGPRVTESDYEAYRMVKYFIYNRDEIERLLDEIVSEGFTSERRYALIDLVHLYIRPSWVVVEEILDHMSVVGYPGVDRGLIDLYIKIKDIYMCDI